MPRSPWKPIAADGLLSTLRSKSSDSLVLQTGFPTSLADLIVKNHGRLKKSSRNANKKPSPSSEIPRLPAPQCPSDAPAIANPSSPARSTDAAPSFRFLVGNFILLAALLIIGKKKLVLGITISAFALLILEICGWRFLKPCAEARKRLDSPPICAALSGSDGKWEDSRIEDQSSELFPRDVCGKRRLGSSGDSKAKKVLKKFLLRRFRRVGEEGRVPHCVEDREEEDLLEKEEEEGDCGDEVGSFRTCDGDLGDGDLGDAEDTYRTHINVDENKLGTSYEFVFFLIVLCGLVRGKAVALLLAMVWCFLYKFILVVRSKRKMR